MGDAKNLRLGCSSKNIWVIKLSLCQNDPLIGESFWQNNSLVTHILFELSWYLAQLQIWCITLDFDKIFIFFENWTTSSYTNVVITLKCKWLIIFYPSFCSSVCSWITPIWIRNWTQLAKAKIISDKNVKALVSTVVSQSFLVHKDYQQDQAGNC